ncbi:MAG: ABC transporter permease [Acidimicrobiaceae bacterium]|nr:ABC transporter permease [Acidimicrobiaceae bacterium]
MSTVEVLQAPRADGALAAAPAAVLVRPTPAKTHRGIPIPRWARRLIAPLAVLGIWQLVCSQGVFTPIELASPVAVVNAGRELWAEGQFQSNLLISLERVAVGLAFGVTIGLVISVLSGLFHWGEDLIDPLVQAARSVPILGLLPLVIIWFGIGEAPKIFLIALGVTFAIYINTYSAIRGVDMKLIEAGRTFGLGRLGLIRRIILPGSLPGFLVGLRLALVHSWLIIVVAEQINAKSGIGYLINAAQTWGRTDIIMLGCTVYAVLGLIADFIVRRLEKSLLAWRRGFEGA